MINILFGIILVFLLKLVRIDRRKIIILILIKKVFDYICILYSNKKWLKSN